MPDNHIQIVYQIQYTKTSMMDLHNERRLRWPCSFAVVLANGFYQQYLHG